MQTTDNIEPTATLLMINGEVNHVVFYAQDTGYSIIKVKLEHSKPNELVVVVGYAPNILAGQNIQAKGTWIKNRQYGQQFKAEQIHISMPTSEAAIKQYLSSGLIKGVGAKTAAKMIQHFPKNLLEILNSDPDKLSNVQGISKQKARKIHKSWLSQQNINDIMLFLHDHGIGSARAIRIYKHYGASAIEKIRENPYRLCHDLHGVGFKTADQLAKSIGFADENPFRLEVGLQHALNEHSANGHCAIEKDQLLQLATQLLSVEINCIEEVLDEMLIKNKLKPVTIETCEYIYTTKLYNAEQIVADKVIQLLTEKSNLPDPQTLQKHIKPMENALGYDLSTSQLQALKTILSHKVCILTGGPGVGKTTLVRSVTQILRQAHVLISIMAPTGRAAKRLQESTSMQAKTIHRTLIVDPVSKTFQFNEKNQLNTEYCIVDETSMLDIQLLAHLLSALPRHTGLLFVGDIDQLPSVGPGAILKDLIAFQRIPTVALTEIFRQAQTSYIIQHAHAVRQGKLPHYTQEKDKLIDSYFIELDDVDKFNHTLEMLITERIPKRFNIVNSHDIQLLCPMRRGPYGTQALNQTIQNILNPQRNIVVKYGMIQYAVADKVMQLRNNYDKDVFNGDIGIIQSINQEEQLIQVRFEDKHISYYFDELDEITHAYAMTIHKSQGSEFPVVIMPIFTSHYMMLERNLIYTGMTRSKQLLIIIGQKKALRMATSEQKKMERMSHLTHHLQKKFKENNYM